MDPLSHAVFGTSFALAVYGRRENIRPAATAAILGSLAPDLDIFIRSQSDPLLFLEYHRQFTHSLLFIPVGGLIVGIFFWLLAKKFISFKDSVIFATLGYSVHAFLDTCTGWGTQLFWPFSNQRVEWSVISIVDPLFTLPLLALLIAAMVKNKSRMAQWGFIYALGYLAIGTWQHYRIQDYAHKIAFDRGHKIEAFQVGPSIGNLLLWRSIYRANGNYYVDAIRLAPLGSPKVYEGGKHAALDKVTLFPELSRSSQQWKDLERFEWFSSGFLIQNDNIIGDARFANLPTDTSPLWGIVMNPESPDEHIIFENFRDVSEDSRSSLWKMLKGESL